MRYERRCVLYKPQVSSVQLISVPLLLRQFRMGPALVHLIMVYAAVVLFAVSVTYCAADDVILQKRSERNRIDMERFMEEDPRRKRPFCNAFTGCGKKRSDDSMATLVELNSEPAVEELSKQILSEAKLWEAIQEARAELTQRHQHQNMMSQDRLGLTMTGLRKKRTPEQWHGNPPKKNTVR